MNICIILLAGAFFACCGIIAGRTAIAQQSPYEINVVIPLTGNGAFLGKAYQQSISLVESLENKNGGLFGRPIKFVYLDDQGSPQQSVQLVSGLIDKHVPVILGPGITGTCAAVYPIVSKTGPVTYCVSPGVHPAAGSYMYSASLAGVDAIHVLLRYMRLRGLTRLALLTTNDATGQEAVKAIDDFLARPENAHMQIVARETYNLTDLSVVAQVAHIKTTDAQALIAWSVGPAFGTALHGLRDSGLDIPVGTSPGNIVDAEMTQFASILPRELYMTGVTANGGDSPDPAVRAAQKVFLDAYRAAGATPDFTSTPAWDAARILVAALRALGPEATAEQVQQYMQNLHGYAGIYGMYDFRDGSQRSVVETSGIIDTWDANKKAFVVVSKPGGYLK
jgi:branched-chain amino acid transport system substrate-binding protein